jgi:membrane protein
LLPNRGKFHWDWTTAGANVGIVLWLILSFGFRLYLQYFDTYARTYGSLGAMIVLMLWLYLTALVILIGGAINAIFDEMKEPVDEEVSINPS